MANRETTHASSSINIVNQEFEPYVTTEHGPNLIMGQVSEEYSGDDLNARGSIRSLLTLGKDGHGSYLNQVYVEGSIGGRSGSFVLQGKGWLIGLTPGAQKWSKTEVRWSVVEGSGTGELTGLRGEGGASDNGEGATATLDYWFE